MGKWIKPHWKKPHHRKHQRTLPHRTLSDLKILLVTVKRVTKSLKITKFKSYRDRKMKKSKQKILGILCHKIKVIACGIEIFGHKFYPIKFMPDL
jgi:hypothetical protein